MNKLENFYKKMIDKDNCKRCRTRRKDFRKEDKTPTGQRKKKKVQLEDYCPPMVGFCRETNSLPNISKGVLIVTESLGGGSWEEYLNKDAKTQMEINRKYHLEEEKPKKGKPCFAKSFFQWNIKKIVDELDNEKIHWFITDLIKCYVAKHKNNKINNFTEAIGYCKKNLEGQIRLLNPKLIVGFGEHVTNFLEKCTNVKNEQLCFPFPSQSSANTWAKKVGDYNEVIRQIKNKLKD